MKLIEEEEYSKERLKNTVYDATSVNVASYLSNWRDSENVVMLFLSIPPAMINSFALKWCERKVFPKSLDGL